MSFVERLVFELDIGSKRQMTIIDTSFCICLYTNKATKSVDHLIARGCISFVEKLVLELDIDSKRQMTIINTSSCMSRYTNKKCVPLDRKNSFAKKIYCLLAFEGLKRNFP